MGLVLPDEKQTRYGHACVIKQSSLLHPQTHCTWALLPSCRPAAHDHPVATKLTPLQTRHHHQYWRCIQTSAEWWTVPTDSLLHILVHVQAVLLVQLLHTCDEAFNCMRLQLQVAGCRVTRSIHNVDLYQHMLRLMQPA